MANWFECKFKYNREDQYGGFKSVSETYLIDAVSFTDAEARVYAEIGANYRDFSLLKVGRYKVHELLPNDEAIKWYKCKVAIITLDEKAGKERKSNQIILVNANSIKDAYISVEEIFSTSVSDYEIMDIVSTNIVEVLPYFENEEGVEEEEIVEEEIVDEEEVSVKDDLASDESTEDIIEEELG